MVNVSKYIQHFQNMLYLNKIVLNGSYSIFKVGVFSPLTMILNDQCCNNLETTLKYTLLSFPILKTEADFGFLRLSYNEM